MQDTIKSQNLVGLADKFNDIKEQNYASMKKEPLGKSMSRTYEWPQQCDNGAIAFGVPTKDSMEAKQVLYPEQGAKNETSDVTQMYIKTHANYAPGQQRNRGYDWEING